MPRWTRRPRHSQEIVLWFEHDLYDQLHLLQILERLPVDGGPQVTMVPAATYLGHQPASDYPELFEGRRVVGSSERMAARDAWQAFRSPDPRTIVAALPRLTGLPHLAAAMHRHLQQFPSVRNGLSRTERQTLEAVAEGVTGLKDVFVSATQDREEAMFIGRRGISLPHLVALPRRAPAAQDPWHVATNGPATKHLDTKRAGTVERWHAGTVRRAHAGRCACATRRARSSAAVRDRSVAWWRASRGTRSGLAMGRRAPRTALRIIVPFMATSYTAKDITVLEGLEPVRKRPGMYIGGVGSTGLHHLVWEVLDNSIDEAMNGYASNIIVTLHKDGSSITITDDGRGIPVDVHTQTKKSALEVIFTVLHAGGKFETGNYKTAGGLHGVGASVVNALSRELVATVKRDGYQWEMRFKQGKATAPLKKLGAARGSGTTVFFRPDPTIFPKIDFDAAVIRERLEIASYLHRRVKVTFEDETTGTKAVFQHDEGVVDYLRKIIADRSAKPVNEVAIRDREGERDQDRAGAAVD